MSKTAILVDGGFYRRVSRMLWGQKSPNERADELYEYCIRHITSPREARVELGKRDLYRLFYYDCPPVRNASVWHPLLQRNRNFSPSDDSYKWSTEFFESLASKRKVALRMGEQITQNARFVLRPEATKDLFLGRRQIADITEGDFSVSFKQGGVDMRIGLDIASLSYGRIVDQVILISGDSDFVPAAKTARRHGIDFLIDPLNQHIRPELVAHTDGIETFA
jgi:uncharacterized LabA/DUF88 family protein